VSDEHTSYCSIQVGTVKERWNFAPRAAAVPLHISMTHDKEPPELRISVQWSVNLRGRGLQACSCLAHGVHPFPNIHYTLQILSIEVGPYAVSCPYGAAETMKYREPFLASRKVMSIIFVVVFFVSEEQGKRLHETLVNFYQNE
jgi:hypothetical protein